MGLILVLVSVIALSHAQYMTYWHNWADEDGGTHLTLCNLTNGWLPHQLGSGPPIFSNSMLNGTAGAVLTWFVTPAGWSSTWHANPVVQFGIWFQGQMTFQGSADGSKVVIDNTALYFGDDVGSKGHHSQNTGQGPALSAMIQYPGLITTGRGPCWPSKEA